MSKRVGRFLAGPGTNFGAKVAALVSPMQCTSGMLGVKFSARVRQQRLYQQAEMDKKTRRRNLAGMWLTFLRRYAPWLSQNGTKLLNKSQSPTLISLKLLLGFSRNFWC